MSHSWRATEIALDPDNLDIDESVFLHGVSWDTYERIAALRGESDLPRLTFQAGVLELMSPGTDHELDKKTLARLFEAYCDRLGLDVIGLGSWTVKNSGRSSGPRPTSATCSRPCRRIARSSRLPIS